ncbi:LysR family transcriptional regulator [Methylobacterium iners]|uniref:HTH-type transcriptional regulator DmlR n=1 Tax=Methylobacterium iners TaxID=418707 RepID=A0ABQ4RTT7_9HYPH|nr:LysR family transcriptional regulator [Methylobacterium iners]GJD94206.1 HTH-type transcriptional regulator DmlR [Methylobacterium iners]
MDRLDAIAAFVAVCDARGFAPAARRLGISPSAATRLIAGLEDRLGTRLLQRTTRSLHLTEAGERYLAQARNILGAVAESEEIARGARTSPRGRLAVAAPVIFGRTHVASLLARYMARHPDMTAELQLNDRNVGLVEEGVDVAVRIGPLDASGLVARRLGTTRRVVVASPDYLARRGTPQHPGELQGHDTIGFGAFENAPAWTFADPSQGGRDVRVSITPRLTTNSGDAALDFARSGAGLVRPLLYQVTRDVAAGGLVLVLTEHEPPPLPIHAVYPSARWLPAKVRAFVDLAAETTSWQFLA